jgi:hypothetical protein
MKASHQRPTVEEKESAAGDPRLTDEQLDHLSSRWTTGRAALSLIVLVALLALTTGIAPAAQPFTSGW